MKKGKLLLQYVVPVMIGGVCIWGWMGLQSLSIGTEKWLSEENVYQQAQRELEREFDSTETFLVVLKVKGDFFSFSYQESLMALSNALLALEGVEDVVSPLTVSDMIQTDSTLAIQPYHKGFQSGALRDQEQYREVLQQSPYWGRLVGGTGELIVLQIKLLSKGQSLKRQHLMEEIGVILGQFPLLLEGAVFAGEALLKDTLNTKTQQQLYKVLFWVTLLVVGVLVLMYGSFVIMGMIFSIALMCVMVSFALINFSGHPFTVLHLILPAILVVIVIADSIHILNRWMSFEEFAGWERVEKTLRATALPCFVTSLTTAVGIGSFMVSDIIPLKTLGQDGFFSMMLSYVLTVGGMGVLLWLYGHCVKGRTRLFFLLRRGIERVYRQVLAYYKMIITGALGLALVSLGMCFFLRTETNFLEVFFLKSSKIFQDFIFVDHHLKGSGVLELLISSPPEEGASLAFQHTLNDLETKLLTITEVKDTVSSLTVLRRVHEVLKTEEMEDFPTTEEQLAQEIQFLELSRSESRKGVLEAYLNFDYSLARMTVRLPNMSSSALGNFLEDMRPMLQDVSYRLAGFSYHFYALSRYILKTQGESLLLVFIVVFLLFLFCLACV